MASPTKTKETSAIRPLQKFEGQKWVLGIIHLPDRWRIITCSIDGSLRVWNLKSGKQIGEDWRDEEDELDEEDEWDSVDEWLNAVHSIALSPDGKKVVSGSYGGAVRLWDIDTGKAIAKWTGHRNRVPSVCWSRDGRTVLSGSFDGSVRQWDVGSGETILKPIVTEHSLVRAVVYSPDMTLIATGGRDGPSHEAPNECSIEIWDAKTGKLVTTLKGHTWEVRSLAWTKDGKTLISGSYDSSIRTWDTTKWEQIAVLDKHTSLVLAIAISPNGRILASASLDNTARLWNLDNGQPIGSPLEHAEGVRCVSFSADGKLLATACESETAYTWDVATIVQEAGLDDLLSDSKANKLALRAGAAPSLAQRRPPAYRIPQGFFNGVPPDRSHFQSSARSHSHSSAQPGSTLLARLFHRSPFDAQDTSPSSPLKWAQALLKRRGQSSESTELQGRSQVVEVPCAPGQRRNACAREKRKRLIPLKNHTASSSQPPRPNTTQQSGTATQTQPSLQPQAAVFNSSTAPAVGDNTAATSSTPSHPDVMLRHAGLWTRFWLFIGCLSPEYQDGRH